MRITVSIDLPGVLTAVFVVLKLTGVIDWSWWWVLSPTLAAGGLSLGRDLFSAFRATVGPADLGAASLWSEAA